jgi:hypothetical protein
MTRSRPPYSLADLPDHVQERLSRPKIGPCGLLDDDNGRDAAGRLPKQGPSYQARSRLPEGEPFSFPDEAPTA